jgi:hypothetical protein
VFSNRLGATAPSAKPSSVQMRFVLEDMAEKDRTNQENWKRVFDTLEGLGDRLQMVEKVQHQLLAQVGLSTTMVEKATEERMELFSKVEETGREVAQMRLEQMGKELGESFGGSGIIYTEAHLDVAPRWDGDYQKRFDHHRGMEGKHRQVLPKWSFPVYLGGDPVLWLDRCMEYFTIYSVPKFMWVSTASMHSDPNVAQWWRCHKLCHGMSIWQGFVSAVTQKYGVDAYSKALRRLMNLRQTGDLDAYILEFDQARHGISVHKSQLDELFFVTHFVRGLKFEIQNVVQVRCKFPPPWIELFC